MDLEPRETIPDSVTVQSVVPSFRRGAPLTCENACRSERPSPDFSDVDGRKLVPPELQRGAMNQSPIAQAAAPRWTKGLLIEAATTADARTAALLLAAAGVPVFPCQAGGKRPLSPHGFHDASTARAQVDCWWRTWPEANVGIPTGAASGVDVVDVDVHGDATGFPAFEKARAAGLLDGWAWLVRTPSGGVHAYFPHQPTIEQRSWQAPSKHIDFRGDGGYIIVPPSQITGAQAAVGRYRPIAVASHEPAPVDAAALRELLEPPRSTPRLRAMPAAEANVEHLASWVASRPEGARNAGLFWAACRMAEGGHDFGTAASLLVDAAEKSGVSEREALTTIRSAYRTSTASAPLPRPRNTRATNPSVEAVAL